MGLAISVGALADLLRADPEGAEWLEGGLAAANALLASAGQPPHVEPRSLPRLAPRVGLGSMPYSFLHYLRRAYARQAKDAQWMATPLADGDDPANNPALEEQSESLGSHLVCHSDAEGFYLPIDFPDPLFADSPESDVPGGIVGSSQRLLAELVLVAPALGITLREGQLSDAEADRIDGLASSEEGLHRELSSWLALFEAARLSVENKTAVVFS